MEQTTLEKRVETTSPQSSDDEPTPSIVSPPHLKKGRKKSTVDPNRKDKLGRTRLFSATTAGHLDKVKELIGQGANVNVKDNANWTPLHEAAINARVEIAKYLIQAGADINVRGYGLDTPLHDACQSNSNHCVKLLVDAGAHVFALNESNKRPIDLCTTEECKTILTTKMRKLDHVMKTDKEGKTLLHHASFNNQFDRAQELIEQGADVNAKDKQETTPLHLACAQGHYTIVKLLHEQGAIVDILGTPLQQTPLHEASCHGQKDIVVYLTEKAKANVNIENKKGETAYDVSASFATVRQHLTSCMDKARLEKESCNALDETARKLAMQNEPERQLTREERKIQNYMRVFAKLQGEKDNNHADDIVPLPSKTKKKKPTVSRKSASIERELSSPTKKSFTKLDPFKKDSSGGTQLHKFASRGDCDTVESLLEAGAKPNEKDYAGWTALHEAALHGHIDVVRMLLKYGANVNSQGADMDTPLHDATENNHCDIVELLLDHGADPFARNIKNAEPIDIATVEGYQDIILVLQNANPVKKKKRPKATKGTMTEAVQSNSSNNNTPKSTTSIATTKKRRLVQAATLEKNKCTDEQGPVTITKLKKLRQRSCSPDLVPVKLESKNIIMKEKENLNDKNSNYIPTKKTYTNTSIYDNIPSIDNNNNNHHPYHSPIHTPPPEQWSKQKATSYSPIYTVQINSNALYYVVDLQVSLYLGLSLAEFYNRYNGQLFTKKPIQQEAKIRLWPTLKQMIQQDKSDFISNQLHFITLDDVLAIMKQDYRQLGEGLLTVALDIGYDEIENNKKYCNLPAKIAMKMKKCGYQQYTT
ncbi:hypothetical protein HPULCUR_008586 [Helicostylum pulchrum]|uniref:Uncharacterized protein n=1 Tax=Helicostylum pulchrum TaxID=562976 RepID=A0ABP9Y823_9FUNG